MLESPVRFTDTYLSIRPALYDSEGQTNDLADIHSNGRITHREISSQVGYTRYTFT